MHHYISIICNPNPTLARETKQPIYTTSDHTSRADPLNLDVLDKLREWVPL